MFYDLSETEFTQMQPPFPQDDTPVGDVVRHRGFGVKYNRRLNLGNWESMVASISLWVGLIPEEVVDEQGMTRLDEFGNPCYKPISLHNCRCRVRDLARTNVRDQFNRARGIVQAEYLGLPEPISDYDPLMVKTVLMSLKLKRNLGEYSSVEPEFSDHCDLRDIYFEYEHVHAANTTGLHMNLHRIWESLWANLNDELARAEGQETTEADFGLPVVVIERVDETIPVATTDEIPTKMNGKAKITPPSMLAKNNQFLPPPPTNGQVHHVA